MKTVTVAALILIVAIPLILSNRKPLLSLITNSGGKRRNDDQLYDIDDFLT